MCNINAYFIENLLNYKKKIMFACIDILVQYCAIRFLFKCVRRDANITRRLIVFKTIFVIIFKWNIKFLVTAQMFQVQL